MLPKLMSTVNRAWYQKAIGSGSSFASHMSIEKWYPQREWELAQCSPTERVSIVSIFCWHSSTGLMNNTIPIMWHTFFDRTSNLTMGTLICLVWSYTQYSGCVHVHVCVCVLWISDDVMELVLAICHKEAAMRQLLAPINTVWEKCDDCTKFNGTCVCGVCVYVCVCVCVWVSDC